MRKEYDLSTYPKGEERNMQLSAIFSLSLSLSSKDHKKYFNFFLRNKTKPCQ
jgi:hypothetical protein